MISRYLVVLNWIQYFSLGFLAQKNESDLENFIKRYGRYKYFIPLAFFFIIIILSLLEKRIEYWGGINPLIGLMGSISAVVLSSLINDKAGNIVTIFGKQSLFIYLWHMPFAGIIANLGNRGNLQYFVVLRPLFILGIFYVVISGLVKIKDENVKRLISFIGYY